MDIISSIAPGISGMVNIHPMVVHFPIAFLNIFLLLEIIGMIFKSDKIRSGASWMLYIGLLSAGAAVVAGFQAAGSVDHNEEIHIIMEAHEHIGIAVLIMVAVLSVWRLIFKANFSGKSRTVYLALAIIMTLTLAFGADKGGLMVYTHGVGVKAVEITPDHDHDHAHSHGTKEPTKEGATDKITTESAGLTEVAPTTTTTQTQSETTAHDHGAETATDTPTPSTPSTTDHSHGESAPHTHTH